ncbi:Hypothetical protein R9X50_00052900 [Acrodontium crateriforme]|uniref:RNA polymerase Rpb4/RPC9 core domain-containing protein n=1 Tax=Acrodontium crateriforme TaxID=150365 RepID=A0AAQ3R4Z9_9PEZI|nr:Hypothetical protein R9X50_00052900 [Acrodontium crateriforme]
MAGPTPLPPVLSRKRPQPTDDENAYDLRLGDMADVPTLSVAECNELLNKLAERSNADPNNTRNNSEIYLKTREYVSLFARFKDGKTVAQVDTISSRLLNVPGIQNFERAQLATLCCDTAEEARTLIPSLEGKIGDDELQQVLDDISKLRDFS